MGSCICPAAASNAPDDGIDRVDGTSSIDAGFITVNATAGSALFYWYTPAESGNPVRPPCRALADYTQIPGRSRGSVLDDLLLSIRVSSIGVTCT